MRISRSDVFQPDAFEPANAIGVVGLLGGNGFKVTGSCFAFGHAAVVLTARHCVSANERLAAAFWAGPFQDTRAFPAIELVEHPTADIALMVVEGRREGTKVKRAFSEIAGTYRAGSEFMAYGFPVEGPSFDDPAGTPIPRVIVGHYQRFFQYNGSNDARYMAGELSVAVPAGLSGAPLFVRSNPGSVTGLVTTNVDSYSIVDSRTEVDENGVQYKEEARRILSYGLALILWELRDWLTDAIDWRAHTGENPPRTLTLRR